MVRDKDLGSSKDIKNMVIVPNNKLFLFYSKKRGISAYFTHLKVGIEQTQLYAWFFVSWFVILPIPAILSLHSHSEPVSLSLRFSVDRKRWMF